MTPLPFQMQFILRNRRSLPSIVLQLFRVCNLLTYIIPDYIHMPGQNTQITGNSRQGAWFAEIRLCFSDDQNIYLEIVQNVISLLSKPGLPTQDNFEYIMPIYQRQRQNILNGLQHTILHEGVVLEGILVSMHYDYEDPYMASCFERVLFKLIFFAELSGERKKIF